MRFGLFALTLVLCSFSVGCGTEPEDDDDASNEELRNECSEMCEHLLAPPLLGCGKSDASDQTTCTEECYDHVTPDENGELEATEVELQCAMDAPDCTAWAACGDFL